MRNHVIKLYLAKLVDTSGKVFSARDPLNLPKFLAERVYVEIWAGLAVKSAKINCFPLHCILRTGLPSSPNSKLSIAQM
jgi:hypothetical protein